MRDESPAFQTSTSDPVKGHRDSMTTWQFPGMTLRDYFAAKAMQAYLTESAIEECHLADAAYRVADAMMEARNA